MTRVQKTMTKMAKIDTLFMTNIAEKPLWGRTYLYCPYKGIRPSSRWEKELHVLLPSEQ